MIGSKGCDSPGCVCCSGPDRPALSQSAEARVSRVRSRVDEIVTTKALRSPLRFQFTTDQKKHIIL